MTFLNLALLTALAAVAVPVILHLLNRRHAQVVHWGATQFLRVSLTSRKRRILLEELILMLLRCLLVALPVLALARPFLPAAPEGAAARMLPLVLPALLLAVLAVGAAATLWREKVWRWSLLAAAGVLALLAGGLLWQGENLGLGDVGASGEQDLVIVIDASTSMTVSVDKAENFTRAIDAARSLIQSLPRSAAVGIVLAGPVPDVLTPAPVHDRGALEAVLTRAKPLRGPMAVQDALCAAAEVLAAGGNAAKRVVLLTDEQKLGWEIDRSARWQAAHEAFGKLPVRPQVICRRFALPDHFRNLAAAEITLSRQVVGTDRAVGIDVRVENTGAQPLPGAQMQLEVDDQVIASATLGEPPPGAGETLAFSHLFESPGAHVIRARVLIEDDMPADNVLEHVVVVPETLPVLVIDGNPAPGPLARASAYAALALAPESLRGRKVFVTPEVLDAMMVQKVTDFARYRVVVLADVPQLPAGVAERLSQFVVDGGGMLIAPGERARAAFYNGWRTAGDLPVTPGVMAGRWVLPRGGGGARRLALHTFEHRALQRFRDPDKTDLDSCLLTACWRAHVPDGAPGVTVAARLDSGDPFLAERRLGKGVVLWSSVSLDSRSGNLVTRQDYLPLLHELVYYLARAGQTQMNMPPGRRALLALGTGQAALGSGGLRGEYFNGTRFDSFARSRVDPTLDMRWSGSPARGVHHDNFSVRWTGTLRVPAAGNYTFTLEHDDAARLVLGGTTLLHQAGAGTHQMSARLVAARPYDLLVDLADGTGEARIRWTWSKDGSDPQVVPSEWLSPVAGSASEGKAEVLLPAGQWREVKTARRHRTLYVALGTLAGGGLYRLKLPAGLEAYRKPVAAADGTVPLTIVTGLAESRLDRLPESELRRLAGLVDLFGVSGEEELLAAAVDRGPGEEFWRHLILAALLLLLAEVALTRWIAGGRRMRYTETVEFDHAGRGEAEALRQRMQQLQESTAQSEHGAA